MPLTPLFMEKTYDLNRLFYSFFEIDYVFDGGKNFDELSWGTQIETLRLIAALRAFTDKEYDISNLEPIASAFYSCFGVGYEDLDNNDIEELKQFFPGVEQRLDTCKNNCLRKENFYRPLFRIIGAGYEYLTMFNGVLCADKGFIAIDRYKSLNIDRFICEQNYQLIQAMKVVLGGNFRKTFTIQQLIENYGYPSVTDEELMDWKYNNI